MKKNLDLLTFFHVIKSEKLVIFLCTLFFTLLAIFRTSTSEEYIVHYKYGVEYKFNQFKDGVMVFFDKEFHNLQNFSEWAKNNSAKKLDRDFVVDFVEIDGYKFFKEDSLRSATLDQTSISIKTKDINIIKSFDNFLEFIVKKTNKRFVSFLDDYSYINSFPGDPKIDDDMKKDAFIASKLKELIVDKGQNVVYIDRPLAPRPLSNQLRHLVPFSIVIGFLVGLIIASIRQSYFKSTS